MMIVVNFKTYPQLTGLGAVEHAKICSEVSQETGVPIIIGLQAVDIYRVASQVKITVFAQHIDPLEPGRHNGWSLASSCKQAGTAGVFLNHSEHQFSSYDSLKAAHAIAKKEGLKTLVFASNIEEALKIDQLNPDYLALEEPSLVSQTAMINFPKFINMIKEFTKSVKSFPVLGAGIRTKEDIKESLALGIKGIAFASEFVETDNPKKLLLEFASCFK